MERYSENYKRKNITQFDDDDERFCKWMDDVENIVIYKIGFNLLELNDELYRDNFENGLSANNMANIVINTFIQVFGMCTR